MSSLIKKLSAGSLFASIAAMSAYAQQDFTGIWQAEVESGERLWIWTIDLVQTGDRVTGTVGQGIGDIEEIHSGVVLDDIVEFRVDIPLHRVITFRGVADGDEIAFTRNVEVVEDGEPGGFGIYGQPALAEFAVTRVPDGQPRKQSRGGPLPRRLIIVDRSGEPVRTIGEPRDYRWPALSPDGRRLAVVIPDRTRPLVGSIEDPGYASTVHDVRVFDLATGASRIVASAPDLRTPVWSPDGSRIAYVSYREGRAQIHQRASDGTGPEELLLRLQPGIFGVMLYDISSDGRLLSFDIGGTLQMLRLADRRGSGDSPPPVELLREEYSAYGSGLSSDMTLIAYLANPGSGTDAFVREFDPQAFRFVGAPVLAGPVAVSWIRPGFTDWRVHWRDDSGEFYYQNEARGVMAVTVTREPALRAEAPRLLFEAPDTGMRRWYDLFVTIRGDGERFVFAVPDFPPQADIAPEILAGYAGTYRVEPDVREFVVTYEEGELRSWRSESYDIVLPMIPVSQTTFFSQRLGEEIDFVTDDAGSVTHLVVYDRGVGRRAVRVEEPR